LGSNPANEIESSCLSKPTISMQSELSDNNADNKIREMKLKEIKSILNSDQIYNNFQQINEYRDLNLKSK